MLTGIGNEAKTTIGEYSRFEHRLGDLDPTPYPNVERIPVLFNPGGKLARRIPGYHALYDQNSQGVFSIVSPKYELVRHEDIAQQLEEVMDRRNLKPVIKTDLIDYGSRMRREYRFDEEKYDLRDGDTVSPTLFYDNGYDKRTRLGIDLGAFRWRCSNGQISGERFYQDLQYHRGEVSFNADDLERAFDQFSDQVTVWQNWMDREATVEDYKNLVTSVEPSKSGKAWIEAKVIEETGSHVEKHEKTEEVMNIPLMSYYILYNVLTAYLTHYVTSLRMRAAAEQKFRRALRQN